MPATMTVSSVESFHSVASVRGFRYNGGMARRRDEGEITATTAIGILGTYRQYFYNLIKAGRVKQHFRKSAGSRPFYLRSEIEALKAELDREGNAGK